jgi:flagellar basal body-associated protein FliL
LVYDFINEFIRNKIELKQLEITDSEILSYFNLKSREHIEMNKWKESTLKKIRQILKNILN